MISKIKLENFSTFENVTLECSSQINIIVGENSCGKTQILKAAYVLGKAVALKNAGETDESIQKQIKKSLLGLFKPRSRRVGGVVNRVSSGNCRVAIADSYGTASEILIEEIKSLDVNISIEEKFDGDKGVFIPTKEVLTLLPALDSKVVEEKHLHSLFDETVVDLCLAFLKNKTLDERELLKNDQRLGNVLKQLCKNIE